MTIGLSDRLFFMFSGAFLTGKELNQEKKLRIEEQCQIRLKYLALLFLILKRFGIRI